MFRVAFYEGFDQGGFPNPWRANDGNDLWRRI